jgi:hypothetical protein
MKIGLGKELTRIALDPKHPYRLANEAEVLRYVQNSCSSSNDWRFPVRRHNPTLKKSGEGGEGCLWMKNLTAGKEKMAPCRTIF